MSALCQDLCQMLLRDPSLLKGSTPGKSTLAGALTKIGCPNNSASRWNQAETLDSATTAKAETDSLLRRYVPKI